MLFWVFIKENASHIAESIVSINKLLGDFILAEKECIQQNELQQKDERLFIFECLLLRCIEFMHLFKIPADRELLQSFMQLLYNSFFLPDYMGPDKIMHTLERVSYDRFLTIENGTFDLITLPKDDLKTLQAVILNIEEYNRDILLFLDYLLVDDYFTLSQLLHVYITISIEYQTVISHIVLPQKPLLSESGKELVRTQAWMRLHDVDFDLTYEIAESTIFGEFFTKFMTIVSPTNH